MFNLNAQPHHAFMEGAHAALNGAYRESNPWGGDGPEASEWDRGFTSAIEQAWVHFVIKEMTDG